MRPNPFAVHRNYRLRRTHVADIREPLIRALWYWRYAQRTALDVGPLTFDPDIREKQDALVEEVLYATKLCNDILADIRKNRELERGSDNHVRAA